MLAVSLNVRPRHQRRQTRDATQADPRLHHPKLSRLIGHTRRIFVEFGLDYDLFARLSQANVFNHTNHNVAITQLRFTHFKARRRQKRDEDAWPLLRPAVMDN